MSDEENSGVVVPTAVRLADLAGVQPKEFPVAKLIYLLMPKISQEIGAIEKNKKNETFNFAFRGIDDVYNAAWGPIHRNRVTVLPKVLEHTVEERSGKNGGVLRFAKVKLRVKFIAVDGSFVCAESIGEALDTGDKAFAKAQSIAIKQVFFETFVIPVENLDPDIVSHELGDGSHPAGKASSQQAAPKSTAKSTAKSTSKSGVQSNPAPAGPAAKQMEAEDINKARNYYNSYAYEEIGRATASAQLLATGGRTTKEIATELLGLFFRRYVAVVPRDRIMEVGNMSQEFCRRGAITNEIYNEVMQLMETRCSSVENQAG